MGWLFEVKQGKESLEAELIEKGYETPRRIKVIYRSEGTVIQEDTFIEGFKVFRQDWNGIFKVYSRLGPELRKKIPDEWYPVLGQWLLPEDRKNLFQIRKN